MAEISLKVYQSKLDDLLARDGANEVIAHNRHILTQYPKNLKAYSQMGQALFSVSRWDESAELFRRLLGGLPYDFVAHSHLGKIYQQLGQIDDAIWHVERSYDQQPNNSEIVALLRKLYKQHRGKDIQRLQLTAGAVAQQHIRNNLYLQAVAVLDKALRRYPNRVDLQVLRARALWLAERHLDAAEGAVVVLEVLPYSLVANRILTELWLMEQRPSDAQRYLSRIEDLDPYLAYRLATGENAPESIITLEELDYEAISRHELSTANPDWLNTMGIVESTDDLAESIDTSDLDDDMSWLDEVAGDTPTKKVTDDLENLLSDEWQAQVDKLDAEPISDDELDDLFGDLDDDNHLLNQLDDSDDELDDLFDGMGDDNDLDDLLGEVDDDDDLQLPEGISTDDLPEGLLDRIEKMKGMSKQDTMPAKNRPEIENPYDEAELTGMLNQLDAEEDDMSWLTDVQQGEYDPSTGPLEDDPEEPIESDWLQELEDIESSPDAQRVSTGLTGMFDNEEQDDIGDVLDALDESDEIDFFADNTPIADSINPDDPTAWMQESGIEFSENVNDAEDLDPFDFESEGVSIESDDVSPVAWLGDSSDADDETEPEPADTDPLAWMSEESDIEIASDTDDLIGNDAVAEMDDLFGDDAVAEMDDLFGDDATEMDDLFGDDATEMDDLFGDDAVAEMDDLIGDDTVSDTDDLFGDDTVSDSDDLFNEVDGSDTDDLFEDLDDSVSEPTATSDDAWLGDDAMLDEMFDLDSEDFDYELDAEDSVSFGNELADASPPHDRQDTMNDDLNNDWQSEQPDDDNDSMGWLNDDGTDDDSGGMPQFFGDLEDNAEADDVPSKTSSDDEVDLEDLFAQMSDDDFNEDDSGLEWLEAEELMESADDVELVIDDLDDDDEEDPLSWLSQPDTDELGEEVAESTGMTDMLNALDNDDSDDEFMLDLDSDDDDDIEEALDTAEEGGHWLDRVGLNANDDDAPATEAEADWLADIQAEDELGEAEDEADVEWLAEDAANSFNFEGDNESEELVDLFDFEEEKSSDFDFEADSDEIVAEEPDWLSTLDTVVEGDDSADETVAEEDADWFPESEDGDDDELEDIVGEQPDWLSGVARDEDNEEAAVESTDEWLSELGEFEDEDDELILDLDDNDDDEAEEVEQPDWLSDVAVAGAGAAATIAASDMLSDDDAEDAEEGDGWLSELGEFEDEAEADAIVDNESNEWIAELGDLEDDDVAEVAEADLSWMTEDEVDHASETAVGATSDVDYLDEVDPITAESALDWMTDADEEDEVIFDELEEQPQGITDFLNSDNDEVEAIAEGEAADWLSGLDDVAEEAEATAEEPDWLSASNDFEVEEAEEAVAEEPDWLTASSDFEVEEAEEAVAEDPDWLSEMDNMEEEAEAVADSGFDFEKDDTIIDRPSDEDDLAEEEADWLSGMEEGDGVQDAFGDELTEDLDWEAETSLEEAQTAEDPDWLSGMSEGDGIQDAFAQAVSEIDEFGDDSNLDDDFDAENVYETDDEDDVTYEEDNGLPLLEEEELLIEETVPSSGLADDDYLADFDEDMEHTPADDAPDWLNAMVPGLDIDYEAEEDEPVDQGFVNVAQTSTDDKGFDWLEDIVEEESQPIKPLAPRPQMVTAPRFQFSKPPAWLEALQGGAVASSMAVASAVANDLDYIDTDSVDLDDDADDISFAELDALDIDEDDDDDEFDFDTFDDDSSDDDADDISFAELDALDIDEDDDDDDDVMFGDFDNLDTNDDNELTFTELDDLEDNFDTQVGSVSDGDDELPDWLDFDDDD